MLKLAPKQGMEQALGPAPEPVPDQGLAHALGLEVGEQDGNGN